MIRGISRRVFLGSALSSAAVGLAWADAPNTSLRPRLRGAGFRKKTVRGVDAIVAEAKLGGRVSFVMADAKTGARLESRNHNVATAPASVTKAITALYALDVLGASHRLSTQLIATGSVSGGVIQGDLILAGGGDPTLDTNILADMARRLKAAGVTGVKGDFKVYDGALPRIETIDTDQPAHVGYSPAVSGIALNFNRVHFEWRRSSGTYGVTMEARTTKHRPSVSMAKMRIAERDIPVYKYSGTNGIDNWSVSRRALGNGGSRWLPVRDPAAYAGDVFRTMAASHGIKLKAAKVVAKLSAGTAIVTHQSAPVRDLLKNTLKFSNNLMAEMIGMAATAKRRGKPASLRASANEMNAWARARFGTQGLKLVDHSGLGAANRMTADSMVEALVKVYASKTLRPILKPVAMRDAKGKVLKNHPVKVDAKTGTLNFVSGLGGYMEVSDGTVLVFAIFSADESVRKRITKANREAPQGARGYNKRAKQMQQRLIERWGTLYSS
ncbi:MAG: D-alanyl-D-alanine carboxypeptidase/D-alanyl-D-alanine-endopeptidase [Ascidiaceihabitans sp.]|nr:D-alanyl-D-alanine carboxypeptidase/D-alanyl-D-alanine-endopeptidase [Ascidiaceihabitans sp.]